MGQLVNPYRPGATPDFVGKVLYVGPGDWVLPLGLFGRLNLPEQVDVMFAPGGRLIPTGAGAELRIHGKITAPIAPIFMTIAGSSAAVASSDILAQIGAGR